MQLFKHQHGYSLLELTLVVAVTGIITASAMTAYRSSGSGSTVSQTAEMVRVNGAIIAFAQRNHRLPCADDNGDGVEGNRGDCTATAASYVSGGVPYVTLGLTPPADFGKGGGADLVYAVYRNSAPSPNADLARLIERNDHIPAANNYQNSDDFIIALASAASAAVSNSYLNVTGDGFATGLSNCAANTVTNVAFALISGGGMDMDKNGSVFDGPHNAVSWPTGNSVKCFAPPAMPASSSYDDSVVITTFEQLISLLKQ